MKEIIIDDQVCIIVFAKTPPNSPASVTLDMTAGPAVMNEEQVDELLSYLEDAKATAFKARRSSHM